MTELKYYQDNYIKWDKQKIYYFFNSLKIIYKYFIQNYEQLLNFIKIFCIII